MKKTIIPIFLIVLMSFYVSAWGAERTVSDNQVTISIDPSGVPGNPAFTIYENIIEGDLTFTSNPGCVLQSSGVQIICNYDSSDPGTFVYQTAGTGVISGLITGGYPSTSMIVGGDGTIPQASCTAVAATCLTEGVICPGNTADPKIVCPVEQHCDINTEVCVSNTACTDTDTANNFHVLGKVTNYIDTNGVFQAGPATDNCLSENEVGDVDCTADGKITYLNKLCTNGEKCQDGICKLPAGVPAPCQDTDVTNDAHSLGEVTTYKDSSGFVQPGPVYDTCMSLEATSEVNCATDGSLTYANKICPESELCNAGVCDSGSGGTLGKELDTLLKDPEGGNLPKGLGSSKEEIKQSWTTKFISQLANFFQSWFS